MAKTIYRNKLPHIQPPDGTFFITSRLTNSIPNHLVFALMQEYKAELTQAKNAPTASTYPPELLQKFNQILDQGISGPTWLAEPKIAKLVKDAFHFYDDRDYELICYCLMSNHFHLILRYPKAPLYQILQRIKRYTALEANKVLGRKGAFWKKESYDWVIRGKRDLGVKIRYTLNNPVKAKLVERWEEWEHSYIHPDFEEFL